MLNEITNDNAVEEVENSPIEEDDTSVVDVTHLLLTKKKLKIT